MTTKVTILRKWNHPSISITVDNSGIELSMTLDDFIKALTDEVAEPLVKQVVQDAGNPTLLFTKGQLDKHMVDSIEGDKAHTIFVDATERVIEAVKAETNKIV